MRPDRLPLAPRPAVRRQQHAVEHLLLLVALAVLAAGYRPLLTGASWWLTVVVMCGAVLLVTGGVRMLRLPAAAVAGAVVGVVLAAWWFAAETLVLAVVPTPASLDRLWSLLDRAGTLVMEEPAPATATPPLLLLAVGAFGLVALTADLLLQRRGGVPLLGLLLVAVYVVPSVVVDAAGFWEAPFAVGPFLVLAVPAAVWMVLLRTSAGVPGRGRQDGSAGVPGRGRPESPAGVPGRAHRGTVAVVGGLLGVGALGAAAVLPPALPDTSALTGRGPVGDGGVFARGVNPMLELGEDLRRSGSAVALEYSTEGAPPYLAVAMLRDFTGETWEPVDASDPSPDEGRADLAPEVEVERRSVEVQIRELRSTLLPLPYPTVGVDGLSGSWQEVRAGLSMASESTDTRGQTYTATALDRLPTAAQLAAAPVVSSPRLEPYLALPDDLPAVITQTAVRVAGGEDGAHATAQALQDYFRSGAFEYSETAPVDGDYDGDGAAVIERFLAERSGYCVHYASAMAVMARALDVPARIMVGYAPGERTTARTRSDGTDRYRVTTDDLHAWPQIYVDGVGWMNFEPTPGIADGSAGEVPDTGADDVRTPSAVPTAEVLPAPVAPTPQPEAGTFATAEADTGSGRRLGTVALVVLLAALAGPALVRVGLRRRRLRRSSSLDEQWREVVATAIDVGLPPDLSTTVGEHVGTLRTHVDERARPALDQLGAAVEQRRFGPPAGSVAVADVNTGRAAAARVVEALLAAAPPGRRLRARVLPRSLLR